MSVVRSQNAEASIWFTAFAGSGQSRDFPSRKRNCKKSQTYQNDPFSQTVNPPRVSIRLNQGDLDLQVFSQLRERTARHREFPRQGTMRAPGELFRHT